MFMDSTQIVIIIRITLKRINKYSKKGVVLHKKDLVMIKKKIFKSNSNNNNNNNSIKNLVTLL